MIEAFCDPKTWMFALFSALNNVPDSLTIQKQLIVESFGFTPLRVTLLGCVDGVVEIVTIWTGVESAACILDSIAYVAIIYTLSGIVLLITPLPWSNKIGLLFAEWLTGIGTINFVLSLSWLTNVTAWHTKRVTVNAIMLSAYCTYRKRCITASVPSEVSSQELRGLDHHWHLLYRLWWLILWHLARENKRRDDEPYDDC